MEASITAKCTSGELVLEAFAHVVQRDHDRDLDSLIRSATAAHNIPGRRQTVEGETFRRRRGVSGFVPGVGRVRGAVAEGRDPLVTRSAGSKAELCICEAGGALSFSTRVLAAGSGDRHLVAVFDKSRRRGVRSAPHHATALVSLRTCQSAHLRGRPRSDLSGAPPLDGSWRRAPARGLSRGRGPVPSDFHAAAASAASTCRPRDTLLEELQRSRGAIREGREAR